MAFAPDYNEVAQRRRELFAKYPDARLRGEFQMVTVGESLFVAYRAECYRTADDPNPGVGFAWEPVPGKTNFTRDSELQNAETSAWGRAILATGASDAKHIASADEVRNREARRVAPKSRIDGLIRCAKERGLEDWVRTQNFAWPWSVEDCEAIELKLEISEVANPPVNIPVSADQGARPRPPAAVSAPSDRPIIPEPPAVSPNQIAAANVRVRVLNQQADISVSDEREERGLPELKKGISEEKFTEWLALLDELESRPFTEANA